MEYERCPICGNKLETDKVSEGNTIVESTYFCNEGHFSYDTHYGITEYHIGNETFGWHYMESPEVVRKTKKKVQNTIEKYKGKEI